MQKIIFSLILITAFGCSIQKMSGTDIATRLSSAVYYPVNPLLQRSDNNPVIQVKIAIPSGGETIKLSSLTGKLFSGFSSIDKLELYYTRNERSFQKDSLIATVLPEDELSFPVSISLPPGLHFLWVHAVIKNGSLNDEKVSLSLQTIKEANGGEHTLRNDHASSQYVGIALRKAWDDSVHTYRIPGIITADDGTLLSVYDIRHRHSGDLPANIDVGLNRSTDGGRTWESMKTIMDMGPPHENNGIGDPAILFDPNTKKIWVAALWSKGNNSIRDSRPGLSPDSSGQFVLVSSDDNGLTWSEPYNITTQVKNPKWHLYFNGPGNGIVMNNGTLVFPSQYWDESKKPGIPHSTIIYSEDQGRTWKSGIGAKANTTEAQVVEIAPGVLMLNMRDNRGKYRSVATTTDMGKTWTEHHTSMDALPDPVCMASFIRADMNTKHGRKDILFFSNVNSQTARINMTIKASTDMGETWPASNELLLDERSGYGYSALTRIDEHTIGILYEGIRNLYFVRIPIGDIIK